MRPLRNPPESIRSVVCTGLNAKVNEWRRTEICFTFDDDGVVCFIRVSRHLADAEHRHNNEDRLQIHLVVASLVMGIIFVTDASRSFRSLAPSRACSLFCLFSAVNCCEKRTWPVRREDPTGVGVKTRNGRNSNCPVRWVGDANEDQHGRRSSADRNYRVNCCR